MAIDNQFYNHPVPYANLLVLGGGNTFVLDAVSDEDYLLIPPPPHEDVRRVADFAAMVINNGAEIPDAVDPDLNFLIVYKTADAEVVLFDTATGIVANASVNLPLLAPIMVPSDRGIFLRVSAPGIAAGLSAAANYYDVRNIERVFVEPTTTPQTLLAGVRNSCRTISMLPEFNELIGPICMLMNFDSVPHVFVISITNGTDVIQLVSESVPAGAVGDTLDESSPSLLEGWSYLVSIEEPVVTEDPLVYMRYTDVNLSPIKTWQGGAY